MTAPAPTLVGRATERAELQAALMLAAQSQPQLVIVQGVAGIGKTTLLSRLAGAADHVDGRKVAVTRVTCDEHEQVIEFGLAGLIIGDLIDPAESVLSVARRLLHWFGQQQNTDTTGVLVIDDAHWMDTGSADAVRFALRRLRSDRILVVIARRTSTSPDPWGSLLADPAFARVVEPSPLSEADVLELIDTQQQPVSLPSAADIVRATGGVPLLVLANLAAPDATGPRTVSPAGAARQMLRGLPPDTVGVIEALAVLAEPTSPSVLATVAGTGDTFAALQAGTDIGMVVLEPPGLVRFSHALLRDAVHDHIPLLRQRTLHRRAAAATTGLRALTHRVMAAPQPDQQLTDELVAQADTARRSSRPGQAAAHLMMARTVSPDPEQRETLVLNALCDSLEAFDLTAAAALEPQARQARNSALRSYALGLLSRDNGQITDAGPLLRAAIDKAKATGDADLAASAAIELARMHASLNEGNEILDAVNSVASLHQDLPTQTQVRLSTMRAVGEWQSGQIDRAMHILDPMTPPDRGESADADQFAARGMIRYFHGDLTASVQDLTYAISLSHRWRPSVMLDRAHLQRSLGHYLLGDWDAAAVDAGAACTLADTGERPWLSALAHATAAMVPANRGQWDLAQSHLDEAERANSRIRSTQGDGLTASAASQLCLVRGDYDQVLDVIAPVRRAAPLLKLQAVRSYRWLMIAAITALTELDRLDEAEAELRTYREMVRRLPQAPGPARLGWLTGRLAQARGDAAAAAAAYDRELSEPGLATSPFTVAEVLYSSGGLEKRMGHRREGIDRLTRARSLFVTLRAAPFIARCDAELAEAGLHQPASPALGLTEREQDVAVLIAKGMTNNEIAAELYLTPKTIEYHLGNIYSKLHLSGRRELRRRLTGG
ncbi:Transcriptional regulatory protein UhpA (plasmid) [Variovorax sp. PBS-H4]|uniref:helix-turn-helix transcriptional regulator n=1 Tax=Variovorax sp. PBS-H4 TaxID=434008 RepID=UPI00131993B5|nr:LuxR family transcriptional regulator [Variovorax sp. PBS-H4]VTU41434.1 Transcriptional regulatory protein UhpA [Variovorax sp. PBS-H4]